MHRICRDIAMKIVGLSDRGEITLAAIERLLIAYDSLKQGRRVTPQERMQEVCRRYSINAARLRSHRRAKDLLPPRIELAGTLRNDGPSYPAIGHIMNRDHTAIMHLVNGDYDLPSESS
jgi:chromosomal replication initiation ATPase DnaA